MEMLRKNVLSKPSDTDPWADDRLQRELVAQQLTKIVSTIRQPFTIALTSPYGTGKTHFLDRWALDLEATGHVVVKFNAWETDFSDSPLLAFVSEIQAALGEDLPGKQLKQKLKDISLVALKKSAPIVVKSITAKLLGDKGFDEVRDSISELSEKATEELFEEHKRTRAAIDGFRQFLADSVDRVRERKKKSYDEEGGNSEHEGDQPLIVVLVDELDRCRPDYAIDVLESIKHFFSVEGFLFVLAVDEAQLLTVAESVFGAQPDTEAYLRKFIDWKYPLPLVSNLQFCEHLYKVYGLTDSLEDDGDSYWRGGARFISIIERLSSLAALSLRQIEHIFSDANLVFRLRGQKAPMAEFIALMLLTKHLNRSLYDDLAQDRSGETDLVQFFLDRFDGIEQFDRGWWMHLQVCFAAISLRSRSVLSNEHNALQSRLSDSVLNEKRQADIEKRMEVLSEAYKLMEYSSTRCGFYESRGSIWSQIADEIALLPINN